MTSISVVTAVYNKHDTVAEALDSLFAQTHLHVESVVIDGGSNRKTLEVLESYRRQIGYFVSENDKGIYDALNKGIARSSGDVVGFLHADDVLHDIQVLERIATAFENPTVQAVYGDLVYVAEDDPRKVIRIWRSGPFRLSRLYCGWMPPHPTFYARRSLYEQLGAFDLRYRIAADYDNMLRLLRGVDGRGSQVEYIPEILVRMRTGGVSNRSLRNILQKSSEDLLIVRRNGVGGLMTIAMKNLSKAGQFWKRR